MNNFEDSSAVTDFKNILSDVEQTLKWGTPETFDISSLNSLGQRIQQDPEVRYIRAVEMSLILFRRRFACVPEIWDALGDATDVDIRSIQGSRIQMMHALLRLSQVLAAGLRRDDYEDRGIRMYFFQLIFLNSQG